ncbi:MAG: yusZ [Nitrososphaeraceae archaeon]|jgi:NAD(P)-dependent dehydrogenase (short-subunit alcohol dehydrogenase family)|nr:yusZ [Nitrososphaeraceae archaeon]MDF2768346.1 yusZ [Nitrososphaeraceae archaeon]
MTPRSSNNNKPNREITDHVAVVTGSSSGIGFEIALMLARSGFHTYATMRNLEKSKKITEIANTQKLPLQVVQLDVNDDISVKNAIDKIVAAENKRIDVLVNNAGYGLFGPLADTSIEEIKAQFETNFFGVIRVAQQVLPVMRKQNSGGTIVNISSVGGRIGVPVLSAYQSTKFALEALSESMSYELEPFGIRVVIIEPGFIRTNIINSSTSAEKALDPKSPYFPLMQKVKNYFKSMMENASSSPPEEVAKVILQAVTSENPQLRYTVGNDAAAIIQARMNMPDKEFRKMVIQNFSL